MVKFVNMLMRGVEIILTILMGAASLIVVAQVLWRYVLHSPLGWTEQISRFAFIWIVMLGIPTIFNRNITMAFDILLGSLHGKIRTFLEVAIRVLGLAFCVFWFVAALELCISTGSRMTSGVRMPQNLLYGSQLFAAALLFLVLLKQIYEVVRDAKNPGQFEEISSAEATEEGE